MADVKAWDWINREKKMPFNEWNDQYEWVEEPYVSPDGERIAAIVRTEDELFNVCVNGQTWETPFEKIYNLRFSPDGRLTALVSQDMEWTVAVDGNPWENWFGFVWNLMFSSDGSHIGAACEQDMEYAVALDDVLWENTFPSITDIAMSSDGSQTSATVQTEPLDAAEIAKFKKGIYAPAPGGNPWEKSFTNVWKNVFSPDGKRLAVDLRLNRFEYTIAVDGKTWDKTFPMVWEPSFNPVSGEVVAPVLSGGWTLASDGSPIWKSRFKQLWNQQFSADGKNLAAIVSPDFGKWTIAVNDKAWTTQVDELITDMVISSDGTRIAAVVKDKGKWGHIVDNRIWEIDFDMAWQPVFSPDGKHVAAKVEKDGKKYIILDGSLLPTPYAHLWNPVFNETGNKLLIRAITNGEYNRILHML